MPLTTSLYVPGRLADREKVLVDVGTGFYVEKVRTCAETLWWCPGCNLFLGKRKESKGVRNRRLEWGADMKPTMQTTKDAIEFYNGKVEDLGKNLADLENVVQGKGANLRVVEDGMYY